MSAHTGGKWDIEFSGHGWCEVFDQEGRVIAFVPALNSRPLGERKANAHLIAAAPAMYEYIASSASNGCAEAKKIMEAIHAGS